MMTMDLLIRVVTDDTVLINKTEHTANDSRQMNYRFDVEQGKWTGAININIVLDIKRKKLG